MRSRAPIAQRTSRSASVRLAALVAVVASAALAACGDRYEPLPPVGIGPQVRLRIVAGDERPSDTVLTRRTLVVEATDARGQRIPGIDVHAASGHNMLLDSAVRARAGVVLFLDAGNAELPIATSQRAATDARGRATFELLLGNRAGEASVIVSRLVIDGGRTTRDTLHVTITPGAPHGVRLEPRDSVVTVDGAFALRATVRDAYGNPLPAPAATLALPADTLVAGEPTPGLVRAARTGRVRVVAASGAWRDTTTVSIVPRGTLTGVFTASRVGDVMRMVTLRTDGTALTEIARLTTTHDTRGTWAPSWVPAAERIVAATPDAEPRLRTYALDGSTQPLLTGTVRPARGESQPRWSYDGAWVWFAGWSASGGVELWRARADGAEAARVGPAAASAMEIDEAPAPSPDGRTVAFITTRGAFPLSRLAIMDVATGERRLLDAAPFAGPIWSPDGSRLLYLDGARMLRLVRPDGADDRPLGATWWVAEGTSFAWSPDGRWVVGHDGVGQRLIEVASGLEIRIPGTEALRAVDWSR